MREPVVGPSDNGSYYLCYSAFGREGWMPYHTTAAIWSSEHGWSLVDYFNYESDARLLAEEWMASGDGNHYPCGVFNNRSSIGGPYIVYEAKKWPYLNPIPDHTELIRIGAPILQPDTVVVV